MANSPDLNPVDFLIWGYLQQLVCRQKICNIQHLKDVIIDFWFEISQQFIDGAIVQWSRRITAVVAARVKHIQYSFVGHDRIDIFHLIRIFGLYLANSVPVPNIAT